MKIVKKIFFVCKIVLIHMLSFSTADAIKTYNRKNQELKISSGLNIFKLISFLTLLIVGGNVIGQTYYSKSTGNLEILSNWGTATDGTGTAPSDFTSANQVFNIRNNANPTIGADWTVSGNNSKIIVGNGTNACNFNIPAIYAVTGTLDVSAGGTLTNTNTTIPNLGTLNATSTVVFNAAGSQTVPVATYGNLIISNTGSSTATAAGAISVINALIVASGSNFDMSTFALTGATLITSGSGILKTQNTTTTPLPTGRSWSMDVLYNSSNAQTVLAGTYANLDLTGGIRTLPDGTVSISGIYTPTSSIVNIGLSTINFSSTSSQTIPATFYYNLTNSGNGARTWANSGTIDIKVGFTPTTSTNIITGSTIKYSSTTATTYNMVTFTTNIANRQYNNLILVGVSSTIWQPGAGFNLGIAGNFSIIGAGTFNVCSNTTANTMIVDGDLTLSNSAKLNLLNSTSNGASATLTVIGNTTTSGGAIINLEPVDNVSGIAIFQTNDFTTTSGSLRLLDFGLATCDGNEFRIRGNFSKSGNGKFETGSTNRTSNGFVFNKSGVQTFSYNGTFSDYTQYVVNSGSTLQLLTSLLLGPAANPTSTFRVIGTLDMGTNVISGSSLPTFTVDAGGTIITSNTGGLASAITTPVTTFTAGANYIFNGSTTTPFHTTTLGAPANVTINANVTLNKSITITNNLSLNSGKLTVGANTLTLNGDLTNDATNSFSTNENSNITLTGSAKTIYFDASNNRLRNLAITGSNTMTLGNALKITGGSSFGVVTVGTGATLATGGFLTLGSDANGTASIGTSTGTISGSLTVERYIPANGRRYRFLSSPVVGGTTLQWRDNGGNTNGRGIQITGPTGTVDASTNNAKSAFYYLETNTTGGINDAAKWPSIDGNTTLTNGQGYRVFVRGDRSISLTTLNTTNNATTIWVNGTYPSGTITLPVTYTSTGGQGWNLVGNPYPSAIDWNASSGWTKTNINDPIAIYRPSTNSYAYYTTTGNVSINDGSNIIGSGQAFWVKANASSPALTCTEAVKTTSAPITLLLKTTPSNQLRIKLTQDSTNIDETLIVFGEKYNDGFIENEDIGKLVNATVNISSILSKELYTAINFTSNNYTEKTIPLSVWGNSNGNYQLDLTQVSGFDKAVSIYLKDKYLNTVTLINENKLINFSISDDSLSKGDERFELIFKNSATNTEQELFSNDQLFVYPNPAVNLLNINMNNAKFKNSEIVVYNISGAEVLKTNMANSTAQLNISNLSNGVYFVKVTNQSGFNKTVKFLK
jgi:hypothetical protein